MWAIFSRCFLSCKVLNVCNLLLLLLGFRKGRLLFLQRFFSFIYVSLDFACLDFTSVIWVVGFAAGPLAVVGFFGVVIVDPLFGFDVSSLLVAGGVVAWDSRGLHGVVGVCIDVVAAFSLLMLVRHLLLPFALTSPLPRLLLLSPPSPLLWVWLLSLMSPCRNGVSGSSLPFSCCAAGICLRQSSAEFATSPCIAFERLFLLLWCLVPCAADIHAGSSLG